MLTKSSDNVTGFDIHDASHYVFTLASHDAEAEIRHASARPARVGTGADLDVLVDPESALRHITRSELWFAKGGAPRPTYDAVSHRPIELFEAGDNSLALSPDGDSVVTLSPIPVVPPNWIHKYPPPYPESAYGLHTRNQDLTVSTDNGAYASEWVRITLSSGSVARLTKAPAAFSGGWWQVYDLKARWSSDGSTIMLPGTFIDSGAPEEDAPCIRAVDVKSLNSACVRVLKRQLVNGYEPGWESIDHIDFMAHHNDQIVMTHRDQDPLKSVVRRYRRSLSGDWQLLSSTPLDSEVSGLTVRAEESYKSPPTVVAVDSRSKKSVLILNPNPQMQNVRTGDQELFTWKAADGRPWKGILYKPTDYDPRVRYPLVIQTHGYRLDEYLPSGSYTSAFAALELASAGIMVLQMGECSGVTSTPFEARCNVKGFDSGVRTLASDGLIDPTKVGIIGFSRTVYHVLAALTTADVQFAAASITDGVTYGYWDFLDAIRPDERLLDEELAIYGVEPVGQGLLTWAKVSPVFNLTAVTTPVRIITRRGMGLVDMWEPYALLQAMHKPVDLIVLNTDQHVMIEPRIRLAAQGGNIDWFRFWLQGYEDLDPAKASQYRRWEGLCKMQKIENPNKATYCIGSK